MTRLKSLVLDSSALILLAKCDLLRVLCDRFEVFVPQAVYEEVATDELVNRYPDAAFIAALKEQGLIRIRNTRHEPILPLALHRGEREALAVAREMQPALFVVDDGRAIRAAKLCGIPFSVSPRIVLDLYRQRAISLARARRSLELLGKIGRYSPDIVADALVGLVEESHGKTDNHSRT
jgi:predicted nucleic acid-binding protein